MFQGDSLQQAVTEALKSVEDAAGHSGDEKDNAEGPTRDLIYRFLPIFTDFWDFLGRLQPSTTTIQKTLNTLGAEASSSPRKALHFLM